MPRGGQTRTAVAEAWRKALDFSIGAKLDPPNAAKEAVSAVENMVKTLTGSPGLPLGDGIKDLEKAGRISKPLDKSFTGCGALVVTRVESGMVASTFRISSREKPISSSTWRRQR